MEALEKVRDFMAAWGLPLVCMVILGAFLLSAGIVGFLLIVLWAIMTLAAGLGLFVAARAFLAFTEARKQDLSASFMPYLKDEFIDNEIVRAYKILVLSLKEDADFGNFFEHLKEFFANIRDEILLRYYEYQERKADKTTEKPGE